MNGRQHHLVKVIQKIEIFSGFDHTDVQRLLKICRFKSYASGEDVYKRGDASDEMLLVLRGMMLVLGEDGKELARVRPGHPMGEMELLTGQPRSADVVAGDRSTALVLRNSDLTLMFGGNRDMAAKVLENVIRVLGARLENTNSLVAAQRRTIRDLERRPQEYGPLDSSDGDDDPGVDVDDDDEYDDEYDDDEEWDDENDE